MPQLWLVRHAPVLAPPGICYGQLDLPVELEATARCAERLASTLPRTLLHTSVLRHSTLQRCELLAQAAYALRPDFTLKSDARLRELNFGAWEGLAWATLPRAELDTWAAQLATYAPGGGERLIDMLARVGAALQEDSTVASETGSDVVWIAHAGVARCVQWLLGERAQRGNPPCSAHWPVHAPAPGAWALYPLPFSPSAAVHRPQEAHTRPAQGAAQEQTPSAPMAPPGPV